MNTTMSNNTMIMSMTTSTMNQFANYTTQCPPGVAKPYCFCGSEAATCALTKNFLNTCCCMLPWSPGCTQNFMEEESFASSVIGVQAAMLLLSFLVTVAVLAVAVQKCRQGSAFSVPAVALWGLTVSSVGTVLMNISPLRIGVWGMPWVVIAGNLAFYLGRYIFAVNYGIFWWTMYSRFLGSKPRVSDTTGCWARSRPCVVTFSLITVVIIFVVQLLSMMEFYSSTPSLYAPLYSTISAIFLMLAVFFCFITSLFIGVVTIRKSRLPPHLKRKIARNIILVGVLLPVLVIIEQVVNISVSTSEIIEGGGWYYGVVLWAITDVLKNLFIVLALLSLSEGSLIFCCRKKGTFIEDELETDSTTHTDSSSGTSGTTMSDTSSASSTDDLGYTLSSEVD